jgi:hypothetical protein
MKSLKDLMNKYEMEKDKPRHISQEFQDYAYRLAVELEDVAHTAIYMRMAKRENRGLLDEARVFVKGAKSANNKGRLFMWKFKQLKDKQKEKEVKE